MLKIKYWILGLISLCNHFLYPLSVKDDSLVCIHGFLGAKWNMLYIAASFGSEGWDVTNWGYKSREKTIEAHAEDLVRELKWLAAERPHKPIHFIAHSLGSLILRAAINHPQCPEEAKIGKAVLLAPPNQGACWGRFLEQFAFARKIAKEAAGKQLMTEQDFEHLGHFPQTMDILVIAGKSNLNPFIIDENDGTVSIEETRLSTPHEHIVIKSEHSAMIFNKKAINLAKQFLYR
jgi:pimeloyl-ACP methyl ester carboxylesterase